MPGSYKHLDFFYIIPEDRWTRNPSSMLHAMGQVLNYINAIQLRSLRSSQKILAWCGPATSWLSGPESLFWEFVSFAEITTLADTKPQEPSQTKHRSMWNVLYASGFSSSNGLAFMHYYQPISLSPWGGEVCPLSLRFSSLHIIPQQTFKFTINPQETFFFFFCPLPVDPFA